MEFFVDNWLWFLIGAIVLLMTLIGYIAEKTDFGRSDIPKKEKIKKSKKQQKEEQVVSETEAMPEVQMSLATDAILEEPTQEEQRENLNVPFGDISFEEPTFNENSTLDNSEELNTSFDNISFGTPTEGEEQVSEMDTIEDLNVPFGDVAFEEPVSEVEEVIEEIPTEKLNLDDINIPNIELPDLDAIVKDEDDSDDVWKF